MNKSQKGFGHLFMMFGLVMAIVVLSGFVVWSSIQENKKPINYTKEQADKRIQESFKKYIADKKEDCFSYDKNCLKEYLSQKQALAVAKAYGVTQSVAEDDVSVNLVKGSQVDVPGVGQTYTQNKEQLQVNDANWYWTMTSCSTNKRIVINAQTGATSGVHDYTICSR